MAGTSAGYPFPFLVRNWARDSREEVATQIPVYVEALVVEHEEV